MHDVYQFRIHGFCYILIQKMKKNISMSIRVSEEELEKLKLAAELQSYSSYSEFLDKDSMIQCEEIRAVSKARLDANRGCIGTLTPEDFNLVKGKFKRAYNL